MLGWLSLLVAGIVCSALLAWLLGRADRLPLDHPNERSLHDRPIPRIGGLGLIPALLVGWASAASFDPVLVLAAALASILFLMSAVDDRGGLPVGIRLGAHLAAGLILGAAQADDMGWLAVLGAALAIAWMTNLYNFMDGANGLAGGMAAFGFASYGVAATMAGADALATLSLAAVGAALGFLRFNFDPARLFLGDAGSIPLGFLAAALGLVGVTRDVWPFWFPLLVFSPFILDASVTLAQRAARGARVWRAHHDHYYQRLIRMGWSHRRLALAAYGLMAAAGLSALWLREAGAIAQAIALVGWLLIYATLFVVIDRRWTRKTEVSA